MNGLQLLKGTISASNNWLVGYNNSKITTLVNSLDSFCGTFNQLKLLRLGYKTYHFIDSSISIQENSLLLVLQVAGMNLAAFNVLFCLIESIGCTHILDILRSIVCENLATWNIWLQHITIKVYLIRSLRMTRNKVLHRLFQEFWRNQFNTCIYAVLVISTLILLCHPSDNSMCILWHTTNRFRCINLCYQQRTIVWMSIWMSHQTSPCLMFLMESNEAVEIHINDNITTKKQKFLRQLWHLKQGTSST